MALRTARPANPRATHAHVVQVAVGEQHALLVTDEGIVYSWGGSNPHGQLGRAEKPSWQAPVAITDLKSVVIVQVACGSHHCLAMSDQGRLFAWGSNKAGQLGLKEYKGMIPQKDLNIYVPVAVRYFDEGGLVAQSISCGPSSSACVTNHGEVYVWGAVSFYLFEQGTKYSDGEGCTVPVRVRGIPDVCQEVPRGKDQPVEAFTPGQVSVYRDKFVCTVVEANEERELAGLVASLKARASQLLALTKRKTKEARDAPMTDDDGDTFRLQELRDLDQELVQRGDQLRQRLGQMQREREEKLTEFQRINRELIVCDQQEVSLSSRARDLDIKIGRDGQSSQRRPNSQALNTQHADIQHIQSANQRSKLLLLDERDRVEQQSLRMAREHATLIQQQKQVESQRKLIRLLHKGELRMSGGSIPSDGLKIARAKLEELAATDPQTLAGVGNKFLSVREVIAISEKALADASSRLREVSNLMEASGASNILVDALEANLKLRKECNMLVQEKLMRLETGAASGAFRHVREANLPAEVPVDIAHFALEASSTAAPGNGLQPYR